MNEIERHLKDALQRIDPPPNFANRVLARVAAENEETKIRSHSRIGWLRRPVLRWAMATAVFAIAMGTGYRIRERRVEEAQALAAKRQVMIALRITGAKLRIARQRVRAVEDAQENTGKPL